MTTTDPKSSDLDAIREQYDRYCEASDKDENLVHEAMLCADNVVPLLAEVERLRKYGTPGVMHEMDKAFYDLTVKERNFERERATRLQAEVDATYAQFVDAEKRLREVRMVRTWINEDGRKVVFADDLWRATDPEHNP